ncbi:hypothetical protein TRICI_002669 [Trichomonascus ciferrii]|uniref:Protein transport protein BOS1 n=1 Tax=Trichomonascus ciferrii TaxID=44093 RepID=A0A642V780_9ASCO|nr:hypothetical protein TRICI_002669 [Trichomonascus ciferrii]
MSSLFNHANKQSQALQRDLDAFAESPERTPLSLQGQISATLTSFGRTVDDYAHATANEIVPERKEKAEARVAKFRAEIVDAKERFQRLKKQREEAIHATSKQELFARRPQQEPASASENPYSGTMYTDMTQSEGLEKERDVLHRAGHQIDEFIERGRLVLGDLAEQRDVLKRTQRSIYSVASTLGVSTDTIRMVEKRALEDKWIFYGGIIVMLLCFYFILKWLG